MSISLKVLVEDTSSEHQALGKEHGLSLYVETPQSRFVFDCGASGLSWRNAPLMGVNLSRVEFAVISHAHYDHAGGFPSLLERVKLRRLYTGVGFWEEKFAAAPTGAKYTYLGAGFTAEDLQSWQVEQVVCEELLQLDDTAWLMGAFSREEPLETIPPRFVRGETKILDDFRDEICLVLREGDGVALITGCAHPGIINMVRTVQTRLKFPVRSVVGGTHLKDASDERIARTLTVLREWGVRRMALCHCSGDTVRDFLSADAVVGCSLSTGDFIELQ
ncbi:MAG: MBL fold metallo-hydrolase [Schwartzia sp. (in: firmicutes)]